MEHLHTRHRLRECSTLTATISVAAHLGAVTVPRVATKPAVTVQPRARLFGGDLARLEVIGAPRLGVRDLYHFLLSASWWRVIGAVALGFLLLNAIFGAAYLQFGSIGNARPGSFEDAFFFSVDTFATVGYGYMYPNSTVTHVLVTLEAFAGLFSTAMVTGLVFAKFARPRSRVLFSKFAVVSDRDGLPTLMFRVANERRNHVVEANMRVGMLRFEVTSEGERIRRVVDIDLVRSQSPAFVLTWTVMHTIKPGSPLYGESAETLAAKESEIVLTLTGLDETLSQTIHARHSYIAEEIRFGEKFADILIAGAGGKRVVDYTKFHDTKPAMLSLEKMGA
jgi:inward rectifier potassium channel